MNHHYRQNILFIFAVVAFVITTTTTTTNGQYYRPPPPTYQEIGGDFDYLIKSQQSDQQQQHQQDQIEKKYVNSGQSVMLVCDLPNNMPDGKVSFIKYDSQTLGSGFSIREDTDDERFEIGQQYAWEWSLKINSINEDDSGIYLCKVGHVIIKQFEIIVKVPPRIRDDLSGLTSTRTIKEGGSVQFSCLASGTPKPNITWYVYNIEQQMFEPMTQTGSYLKLENITRYTPRRYQCRATNNIPPSDRRNITFAIEFPPEIEIQPKYNPIQNTMTLNCTISANPLTNRHFWRKDGNFISEGIKHDIRNMRVNEFTLISQLIIKNYNEFDQGLYECTGENDLRVSKIVYSLKDEQDKKSIGGENNDPSNLFASENLLYSSSTTKQPSAVLNELSSLTSSIAASSTPRTHHHGGKNRKYNNNNSNNNNINNNGRNHVHNHKSSKQQMQQSKQHHEENTLNLDPASSESIKNIRKHQRNHKNNNINKNNLNVLDRLVDAAATSTESSFTNNQQYFNSPYILLLNDDVNDSENKQRANDQQQQQQSDDRLMPSSEPEPDPMIMINKANSIKNLKLTFSSSIIHFVLVYYAILFVSLSFAS